MIDVDITGAEFGIEVSKRLIELGITKKEVSEEIGINNAYLCDILKNNRKAYKRREQILEFLNSKEHESGGAHR